MRTIRIIEHISLDGVNSGPRWRERRPTLSLRRMGGAACRPGCRNGHRRGSW